MISCCIIARSESHQTRVVNYVQSTHALYQDALSSVRAPGLIPECPRDVCRGISEICLYHFDPAEPAHHRASRCQQSPPNNPWGIFYMMFHERGDAMEISMLGRVQNVHDSLPHYSIDRYPAALFVPMFAQLMRRDHPPVRLQFCLGHDFRCGQMMKQVHQGPLSIIRKTLISAYNRNCAQTRPLVVGKKCGRKGTVTRYFSEVATRWAAPILPLAYCKPWMVR